MLATVTTRLLHHVRLVHASTGRAIGGLTARFLDRPYGWGLRVLADGVVVFARADVAAPGVPPQLAITLRNNSVLVQPPHTVVVDLDAEEIEVPLHPVPMTLTVILTTPSTGVPSTGRTVTARATGGPNPKPTIDLPEVEPGVYRSAAVEWTAVFTPLDLLVAASPLRTLYMDQAAPATTVRLIDTA